MAAKEQWKEMGNVPAARQILAEAFAANPDSEVSATVKQIWGGWASKLPQASFPTPMYQHSQDIHIQDCCMSHQLMPSCFPGRRLSPVGLVVWESSCFCLDTTGHLFDGV